MQFWSSLNPFQCNDKFRSCVKNDHNCTHFTHQDQLQFFHDFSDFLFPFMFEGSLFRDDSLLVVGFNAPMDVCWELFCIFYIRS
jgi:hypothetical protein